MVMDRPGPGDYVSDYTQLRLTSQSRMVHYFHSRCFERTEPPPLPPFFLIHV